ncbi:hypothetical protein DFQ27_005612 [Actinomortierella ambigua]|uniref:Uncharacterized protein n=1 Tax=Actinomortierella ambigua TaxID=1343610 RepID=A0A9P6QM56_9FUNG|nr:hypothetical protein DFQ27_005612 [Actinomortierella ambigua]
MNHTVHATAIPPWRAIDNASLIPRGASSRSLGDATASLRPLVLAKRATPSTLPVNCTTDFDCLEQVRPDDWPVKHDKIQTGGYACIINPTTDSGTCQFVVSAGELCHAATECAASAFYARYNIPIPDDLCAPKFCTIESNCGSAWEGDNAPSNSSFTGVDIRNPQERSKDGRELKQSCCGGVPNDFFCSLVGSNVDTCEYHHTCTFKDGFPKPDQSAKFPSLPSWGHLANMTRNEFVREGLGHCVPIDQRKHVWIGVVITLISSTVLNLGLNGQKYALRKHDQKRIQKQLALEEEQESWRTQLGWSEEQVQAEMDRRDEEKKNRRSKLYRRLEPLMFWREIIVSKLWALGLLVFIIGNLGGFVALRFAPQSLTAPLGSISLISNVIIAPLINKEVLGRWDIVGIVLIVGGSVIVVVFSGIVAQDYKLCVLINLFKQTSTIIYLAFIGLAIIGTFCFIKFVEKNVENESDMAIGVSSERVLEKEGRLVRMHSHQNASSASLGQFSEHQEKKQDVTHRVEEGASVFSSTAAAGTDGPSSPHQPLYQAQSTATTMNATTAITSNSSHTSLDSSLSESTDRAAKEPEHVGGTEADTGMKRPKLQFEEQVNVSATSTSVPAAATGGVYHPPTSLPRNASFAPSIASVRSKNRRQLQRAKQRQKQAEAHSLWGRIKAFEVIPRLPEHKLIRRNSPLLRFFLPLSYAAMGGLMASITVLFAKSLINLLVTSIFEDNNQFTSGLSWIILVITVVTAVSQVYWINMGLKKYDALLQVPVFFTIWVLLDIIGGGIYYGEFKGFTAKKYVMFCLGVLIVFTGVGFLAKRLAVLAREDAGVASPSTTAASQRNSAVVGGSDIGGGSTLEGSKKDRISMTPNDDSTILPLGDITAAAVSKEEQVRNPKLHRPESDDAQIESSSSHTSRPVSRADTKE